ncbi:hypothetical protein F8388_022058 [Cannabis sativa]|uniref:Stress response NST1-like protein n=1 Tax=Cannabis sativa TaxID=3483 RepID=A0A7J6G7M7_CANSA|nr:hypothetical protein F8388_022058 [Cannabis sativa]
MCILCVIQKWSRRVATMLPWLVIPLIGLWALSQLLPPAYRFEITSPRLACVFVLLITLFWYEILMPQLSAWRVRRSARLRERKRSEAIELQKLRKTATRRCRNCLTPYREQNPGGGRFMCSYCGHISKRPVLDLPVPTGISNAGILKDLVGKSGKILNGKVWSDNGWMCGQDWLENGNWVGGGSPVAGKNTHWRRNGSGLFGGDENCLAEKSYSGVVIFACKLLTSFFLSVRWLWRKIFRISSSTEDDSSDAEHKGMLAKSCENGGSYESRGEKARRKAEEKRQARLEREMLEEEERKQREEVARLVEERRRLRDEKMETEKDREKMPTPVKEKDSKKEAERKRQERRKEKDKGSSKSNSDVEELEKKTGKESEKKKDFDRKNENDRREHHKSGIDPIRVQNMDMGGPGMRHTSSNFTRFNSGTRYLDRMRGTFLSSSKAFGGGSFFGRGTSNAATTAKESKPNSFTDQGHIAVHRKDVCPPERVALRSCTNLDDKNTNRLVHTELQPGTAPKKSWQQLFTRSPAPPSNSNVISRPNSKFQVEVQSPQLYGQPPTTQSFDNPINFGSPFTLPTYPNVPTSSSLGFSPAIEPIFPRVGEGPREHKPEESELFEDPSYIPDPVSLLGPVSESLDNFQLDLGTSRAKDFGLERARTLKSISAPSDVSKPSPIESPLSREKHISSRFPTTPNTQNLPLDDSNANESSMWQMWNTLPLGQDGLGLVGGPASWLLSPELNRPGKDEFVHPSAQKTMASLFTKEEQVHSGSRSPQNIFHGNGQNGGTFSPVTGSRDSDPWSQKPFFPPISSGENLSVFKPQEESTQNEMIYGSPRPSRSTNHPFEQSPANGWSKNEWTVQGTGESIVRASTAKPQVGGLFPGSNVQSLW